MIAAGRLRHRVTVAELTAENDTDGVLVETWEDAFGVALPAEITALSGRELIAAQAIQSKVTARIRLRYRPGLKASQRVEHRGEFFNIVAVVPDPYSRIRYTTLLCESGVIVDLQAPPVVVPGDQSLDFSVAANSQYLALLMDD